MTDHPTDGLERRQELYEEAEAAWGREAQLNKAAEEFGEAAAALNRALNGQESRENLLEELADARLMLEQMEWALFDDDEVGAALDEAVANLEARLEVDGDG
ncbi:hypothetical protein [Halobellus rubicundus]|uniref:Nucleotide pyrophosphohydrolase n=1 Tax=Halobellus rubicundus TaxID=2996466 RepID=A0ABD5MHM4_9EURY